MDEQKPLAVLASTSATDPLVLDPWQELAADKGVKLKRFGLGAEMGMGKTPVGLEWMDRMNPSSVLIVCTKRAMIGWLRMMKNWFPGWRQKFAVIVGLDRNKRHALWAKDYSFVITTYNFFQRDIKHIKRRNYQCIIFDEAHKFLRNRDNKTFKIYQEFVPLYLLIITGSPSSKGVQHFWTYLNMINPRLFKSYWRFIYTFCVVEDNGYGKTITGQKNVEAFQSQLRQHFILVQKSDVGVVKKRRQFIDCVMTKPQKEAYLQLQMESLLEISPLVNEAGELEQQFITAINPMTVCLRLRQILCCPAMLDPKLGLGGALTTVLEELLDMDYEDRHCVIFTPFREAALIIADQVVAWNLRPTAHIFMGGLSMEELESQLDDWRKTKGIAVCTIKYAESFDMETCDKGFFVGYEWDPYENYQAEDRVDRRNNTNSAIRMFYARTLGSYDEDMMDALVHKAKNLNEIYSDPRKLVAVLKSRSGPDSETELFSDDD